MNDVIYNNIKLHEKRENILQYGWPSNGGILLYNQELLNNKYEPKTNTFYYLQKNREYRMERVRVLYIKSSLGIYTIY